MIFFLSIVHLDYIKKKKKKILDPLPPQSPSFATLYIRASINLIDALCLCRHGKCCYSFRRRCFCLSFVSFLSFFFSFLFFFICHAYTCTFIRLSLLCLFMHIYIALYTAERTIRGRVYVHIYTGTHA